MAVQHDLILFRRQGVVSYIYPSERPFICLICNRDLHSLVGIINHLAVLHSDRAKMSVSE